MRGRADSDVSERGCYESGRVVPVGGNCSMTTRHPVMLDSNGTIVECLRRGIAEARQMNHDDDVDETAFAG
jgi:hypothetical protein